MNSLKVGEIVKKLYIERDSSGSGIVEGGASNYHDRLGHVIAAIFLTDWPQAYKSLSSPVVFSTQTLVAEQISELVQRMLVRCSPGNIREHKLLYSGSLEKTKITRIQDNICSKFKDNRCQMNIPYTNGHKLSKNEALSWVFLFAIEDLHVFAKSEIGQIIDRLNCSLENKINLRKKLFEDSNSFNDFKEKVAHLMYYMATNPEALSETKKYRKYLMKNCRFMMDLEEYNAFLNPIIGKYLSDDELSDFYDTFIEDINDLDRQGIHQFGKPFSAMTMKELDTISIRHFLPSKRIPFKLILKHDISGKTDDVDREIDRWVGIARYEARRDIYPIEDILPPSSLTRV